MGTAPGRSLRRDAGLARLRAGDRDARRALSPRPAELRPGLQRDRRLLRGGRRARRRAPPAARAAAAGTSWRWASRCSSPATCSPTTTTACSARHCPSPRSPTRSTSLMYPCMALGLLVLARRRRPARDRAGADRRADRLHRRRDALLGLPDRPVRIRREPDHGRARDVDRLSGRWTCSLLGVAGGCCSAAAGAARARSSWARRSWRCWARMPLTGGSPSAAATTPAACSTAAGSPSTRSSAPPPCTRRCGSSSEPTAARGRRPASTARPARAAGCDQRPRPRRPAHPRAARPAARAAHQRRLGDALPARPRAAHGARPGARGPRGEPAPPALRDAPRGARPSCLRRGRHPRPRSAPQLPQPVRRPPPRLRRRRPDRGAAARAGASRRSGRRARVPARARAGRVRQRGVPPAARRRRLARRGDARHRPDGGGDGRRHRAQHPRRHRAQGARGAAAAPGVPRPLTGLPNRALFPDRLRARSRAARRDGDAVRRAVPRPRRLQGGQRHARARRGRPPGAVADGSQRAARRRHASRGSAATSSPSCSTARDEAEVVARRRADPARAAPRRSTLAARACSRPRERRHRPRRRPRDAPTSCCATPTSRCTRAKARARAATRSSSREHARRARRAARSSRPTSRAPGARRARGRTTSRSSTCDARHDRRASRRSCAGSTRRAAWSPPAEFIAARRGDRADRAARPLGAARGVPAGARWQRGARGRAAATSGQPLGAPARRRRPASSDVRASRSSEHRPRPPSAWCSRSPRALLMERRRARRSRGCATLQELGVRLADRRLRHGLLVAGLPAALPDRRAEDRPAVRRRARRRPRRRGARRARSSSWPTTSACRPSPRASRRRRSSTRCAQLGCDLGQGYHLPRPLTAAEVELLRAGARDAAAAG